MGKNKQRPSSAGKKLLVAAGLLLIIAVAQYLYQNYGTYAAGGDMLMTETQKGVAYDFDAGASFYSYNARFFYFCTKDGMQSITSGGKVNWTEAFTLTKPVMTARGGAVAVGEVRGKHIYVFNEDGLSYDVPLDYPALYFSVNAAGYLAVILQLDQGYEVHVYSPRGGAVPIYRNSLQAPQFHPTAADVSEDGKYIAIALLDVNTRITSRAAFYYINRTDVLASATDDQDGLFAWEDYPGQVIYCLRFMAENNALIFTDEQIACYRPGEYNALDEQWTVSLHNELTHLDFYGGTRFVFVSGDKRLNDEEAQDPGTVNIYNAYGERTGTFTLGRKATYVSMGRDAVIVGAGRTFYALNSRGGTLWEHTTLQDTYQMIFLDNTDTVLMAGSAQAVVLKRERPKNTDAGESIPPLYSEEGEEAS